VAPGWFGFADVAVFPLCPGRASVPVGMVLDSLLDGVVGWAIARPQGAAISTAAISMVFDLDMIQ